MIQTEEKKIKKEEIRVIDLVEKYKSIIFSVEYSLKDKIKKLLEFSHYCCERDIRETDCMVLNVFYCLCFIAWGRANGFEYYHYATGWSFNTTMGIAIDYIKQRNKKVYIFIKEIENDTNNSIL